MKPAILAAAMTPSKPRAPDARERAMNSDAFSKALHEHGGKHHKEHATVPPAHQRLDRLALRIAQALDQKTAFRPENLLLGGAKMSPSSDIMEPGSVEVELATANDNPENAVALIQVQFQFDDGIVLAAEPPQTRERFSATFTTAAPGAQAPDQPKSKSAQEAVPSRRVRDTETPTTARAVAKSQSAALAANPLNVSLPPEAVEVGDEQSPPDAAAASIRSTDRLAATFNNQKLQTVERMAMPAADPTHPVDRGMSPSDASHETADPAKEPAGRATVAINENTQRTFLQTPTPSAPFVAVASTSVPKKVDAPSEVPALPPKRTIEAGVTIDDPERGTDIAATTKPDFAAKPVTVLETKPTVTAPDHQPAFRADRLEIDDDAEPPDEPAPMRAADANTKTTLVTPTVQAGAATPAVAVVTAVAGDHSVRQLARAVEVQAIQAEGASTHSLKIQLHPAELGMVTATLRLAGDRMSVELATDRMEAYERLSIDSETIIKSLRALGLQVDQVTVQPPQVAVAAQGRTDADAQMPASAGREQQLAQAGQSSGGDTGSRPGRRSGGGNGNGDASAPEGPAFHENRDGRGLFI